MRKTLEMPVKAFGWPSILETFSIGETREYPIAKRFTITNAISGRMKVNQPDWVFGTDIVTKPKSILVTRKEDIQEPK